VHWAKSAAEHRAAIITAVKDVDAEIVSLRVFSKPGDGLLSGSHEEPNVPPDETGMELRTWHWPERES
jgi:hypothetical protein